MRRTLGHCARRTVGVLAAVSAVSTLAVPRAVAGQAPAPPVAQAGAQARTATVTGLVSNLNGIPIPKAEVFIDNTELRVVTNDSGVFKFDNAPAGRVRIIVRRIGFEPEEQRVSLDAGRHKQVDFELKGVPESLDSVMVREAGGNGRMSDFWSRRMVGVGAFITRADIERRHAQTSSDLLRTVTGVKVTQGESGFDRPVISMGRNAPVARNRTGTMSLSTCNVSYYVGGSYVPSGTFHMDDLSPLIIEAVEVYRGPAETPAKLRQRDTACGVIVIWTREPPSQQKKPARD